jgi:GTPase SAR1 family protein
VKLRANKRRDLILIFGKVGSGKTTLAEKLAEKMSRSKGDKQIIIFDLNEEHEGHDATTAAGVELLLTKGIRRIVYRPMWGLDDIWGDVDKVFAVAWEYGEVILLVDEAEIWIGAKDYHVRRSNFLRCVQFGRHRLIDMICCSRRIVELNIFVRAQATEVITFRQTERRDLDRLEDIGFDAGAVKSLGEHKFLSLKL